MSWRILHVVRSLRPETGGLVPAVENFSAALRALGHRSTHLSLDPADGDRVGEGGRVLGNASEGYGRAPEYVRWLREHRTEFDAVLVHGLWQQQTYGAWQALRGTGTPYFVFCHGMLDPWFKRTYPLKHLKKWLYWPWAEYRVLRDAAGVCFTAEEERRAARESFWLYRARELITPLGIAAPPVETAAQREAFYALCPELRETPFLLFLARIHPKKGIENLLRGYAATWAARADAPRLAIVGPCADAAYLASLQALAARLGIAEAVRWPGLATGAAKWGALYACEAFVLLSHQENFGVAVVEALACGKPVLISRPINIWREIVDDGAGLAVADDAPGAAAILRQWLGLPSAARVTMQAAARACYQRRFAILPATQRLVDTLTAPGQTLPLSGKAAASKTVRPDVLPR